jgi:hypothetical protein
VGEEEGVNAQRIIALLLLANVGRSTSILALYTPQAIYIGSDSKISRLDGTESRNGCKILIAEHFVFASAGLSQSDDGTFDLPKLAFQIFSTAASFSSSVSSFEERLGLQYGGLIKQGALNGIPKEQVGIDVVVGGIEKNLIKLSQLSFGRLPDQFIRRDCPSQECTIGVFELGERAAIDGILKNRHAIWKELGVPDAIKHLILAQERASPKLVGGPIAIVEIGQAGIRWISKGACE